MKPLIHVLGSALLLNIVQAELDLAAQNHRFQSRLDAALIEFEIESKRITEEKIPLVTALNDAQLAYNKLLHEVDTLQLSHGELESDLLKSEERNAARTRQIEFIEGMLLDHLSNFDTFVSTSEDQIYRPRFSEIRETSASPSANGEIKKIIRHLSVIELSLDRLEKVIGGYQFQGSVVEDSGRVLNGKIFQIGPTSYFLNPNGGKSGALESTPNSLIPKIASSPKISTTSLRKLSEEHHSVIPLDATLGKASGFDQSDWSLRDHVKKGGYVGYVIIGFAVVCILITCLKLLDLSGIQNPQGAAIEEILSKLQQGQKAEAEKIAEEQRYPANQVLSSIISRSNQDKSVIEETVIGEIQSIKSRLERFLPFLAVTAATAPLLGLLGTVVGMIKTFSLITVFGTGEAKFFSSGISEALITTELGLIVAIPALILHSVFQRSVRDKVATLEEFASDFVIELHTPNDV